MYHGKGELRWTYGDCLYGDFEDGWAVGQVKMVWANGTTYVFMQGLFFMF